MELSWKDFPRLRPNRGNEKMFPGKNVLAFWFTCRWYNKGLHNFFVTLKVNITILFYPFAAEAPFMYALFPLPHPWLILILNSLCRVDKAIFSTVRLYFPCLYTFFPTSMWGSRKRMNCIENCNTAPGRCCCRRKRMLGFCFPPSWLIPALKFESFG